MLLPLENAISLEQVRSIDPAKLVWLGTSLVPYGGLLAANFQPGQVLMVNGATGHFGSAGVAVALVMGAVRVIAPGRSERGLNTLVNQFGERVRPVLLSGDEAIDGNRIAEASEGPIDCMLDSAHRPHPQRCIIDFIRNNDEEMNTHPHLEETQQVGAVHYACLVAV
jgi:alcohol dehydrogenase